MPKQKQKQKQTQIVNIHLGTKARKSKGKGKSRPKKSKGESKTQIIPAFNPPPIINYPPQFVAPNQPNWFQQPPLQVFQKQYSALPESETAGPLNLNPSIPVPFSFIGAEERLKPPVKEPKLESLVSSGAKAEEEVVLPTDAEALAAELASAEAAAIEGEAAATAEEEASIRSALTAPSVGPPTYDSGNPPTVESVLGERLFGRNEALQPFNVPIFAESSPFFPVEAISLAQPKEEAKEKKQKKKSSSSAQSEEKAGSIHSFFPSITPARQLTSSEVNLATGEPHNFPPPLFNIPITTEKLGRTFTLGSPAYPTFIGQPKEPPEKTTGEYLQRQRASGITPAEESILFA